MKYLSFLLVPVLSFCVGVKPTNGQDSFASQCYLNGSLMKVTNEGYTVGNSILKALTITALKTLTR